MARPYKDFPPRPSLRRDQGYYRVSWRGSWYYLGPASQPARWRAEYARLCSLWSTDPTATGELPDDLSVARLWADYRQSDRVKAHQQKAVAHVARLFLSHHAGVTVGEFGPRMLAAWIAHLGRQQTAGRDRYSRSTIQKWTGLVKSIWRWGVETERIPVERYQALLAVRVRDAGREPKKVKPANPEHVRAILPHLRGPVRAMVELQLLTGMRPSELFRMTPGQVHRSGRVELPDVGEVEVGPVWVYLPTEAKTRGRWVVLGPRAQKVLRPFLERSREAACFDPRESLRTKQTRPSGRVGVRYTRTVYANAVKRACVRAGVPELSPYQLRHRTLTDVDDAFGLDAAQAVGGHSSPQTTRRYAKRSFLRAVVVAKERG